VSVVLHLSRASPAAIVHHGDDDGDDDDDLVRSHCTDDAWYTLYTGPD